VARRMLTLALLVETGLSTVQVVEVAVLLLLHL
jgi:hypothetical protein